MSTIFSIYDNFLGMFPAPYHGLISIALAILIVIGIYKIIKQDFIWLIVLIILLPASIPILKNIWDSILSLITFLLSRG